MYRSISTVGADIARKLFGAEGQDIVWALVDSGVDGSHPHFQRHGNLDLPPPLTHRDFTAPEGAGSPLVDATGTGTASAGIIGGEVTTEAGPVAALTRIRDEMDSERFEAVRLPSICGMSPRCKLLSLKVLGDDHTCLVSSVLLALQTIHELNAFGRRLLIHG